MAGLTGSDLGKCANFYHLEQLEIKRANHGPVMPVIEELTRTEQDLDTEVWRRPLS